MSWPHATTTISAKEILGFHPHSSQHHQLYSERPSPRQYNLYRSLSLFIRGSGLYIFPNWSIEVVGSSKWRLFAMFHHGLDPIWVLRTQHTLSGLGIKSWVGVRNILAKFPWVTVVHDKAGQILWHSSNQALPSITIAQP